MTTLTWDAEEKYSQGLFRNTWEFSSLHLTALSHWRLPGDWPVFCSQVISGASVPGQVIIKATGWRDVTQIARQRHGHVLSGRHHSGGDLQVSRKIKLLPSLRSYRTQDCKGTKRKLIISVLRPIFSPLFFFLLFLNVENLEFFFSLW